jgi:hypothetical protein
LAAASILSCEELLFFVCCGEEDCNCCGWVAWDGAARAGDSTFGYLVMKVEEQTEVSEELEVSSDSATE